VKKLKMARGRRGGGSRPFEFDTVTTGMESMEDCKEGLGAGGGGEGRYLARIMSLPRFKMEKVKRQRKKG
jgi:hypothetical protein